MQISPLLRRTRMIYDIKFSGNLLDCNKRIRYLSNILKKTSHVSSLILVRCSKFLFVSYNKVLSVFISE